MEERREKGRIGMLLRKRPRPPTRRTTSMSGFTFDIVPMEPPAQPTDNQAGFFHTDRRYPSGAPEGHLYDPRLFPGVASLRNARRNSNGFVETAHFLRACGFCRRRLAPGKDIYMYRGDTAFCSLECRQHQMNQDERNEKCSLLSVKKEGSTTAGSESSTKGGETMAAA